MGTDQEKAVPCLITSLLAKKALTGIVDNIIVLRVGHDQGNQVTASKVILAYSEKRRSFLMRIKSEEALEVFKTSCKGKEVEICDRFTCLL